MKEDEPKSKKNNFYRSRITDWPVADRPRERLMSEGPESVSSVELIAILLGQGTVRYNAVELARRLLNEFGTLQALSDASFKELQKIPGIGPAKAVTLLAAFQIYRNLQKEKAESKLISFRNPAEVARIYQPVLGHRDKECFFVVLLDTAMKRISDFEVSRGTLDSSIVHPRDVFNKAVRYMAKGIIVLHNHPSGNVEPSDEDVAITERLVKSGDILGIPLYDHIILSEKDYFSFKARGMM
ncbi:MAG TPA: JAB domain-containing protein [Caldithrix abyssi]|uniref:JAB domain-containing protein n=1 Tax=Caldithrix abyssi TaxID=187145 RepID=A0A7V4U2A0_CALAY|nr:JAB domain-containing protein [Caldithrix abyssi]